MTRHCYSLAAVMPDYLRAGIGAAITGGPLLFVSLPSVMLWLLGGLAALFLAFGVRTWLRQATCIELTASGIRASGPIAAMITWEDLRQVELRYFSTRRDRSNGWMQLSLSGGGRRIRAESSIDDFAGLAAAAIRAATAHGVPIGETSRANLAALGRPGGGGEA